MEWALEQIAQVSHSVSRGCGLDQSLPVGLLLCRTEFKAFVRSKVSSKCSDVTWARVYIGTF